MSARFPRHDAAGMPGVVNLGFTTAWLSEARPGRLAPREDSRWDELMQVIDTKANMA